MAKPHGGKLSRLLAGAAVVAALAAVAGAVPAPTASDMVWASTDVDGGSVPAATGAPVSLAMDANRQPHLFYSAAFELPHTYRYATPAADGSWDIENVDTFPFKYGTFDADTHIALDAKGGVHVLYTKEGVDPSPCAGCSSCASCPGSTPPACCATNPGCCDGPQWGELWYATRSASDGKWTPTLIDRGYRLNTTDPRPMDCSLTLDADGVPHVAYYLERPAMQLMMASVGTDGSWHKELIATDGGYDNHLHILNGYPMIVYWSEECFCVRIWAQTPGSGPNVTGTVGETGTGATAQGYGIATAVGPSGDELLVSFTRNVYADGSLRSASVPLLASGGVGTLPTTSTSLQFAARASATAVSYVKAHPGSPTIVAYSYGTSDPGPFQVRTTSQNSWQAVPATVVNGTGALSSAAALAMRCCDARGLPVMAYTRRPSMYESYLAYATLQNPSSEA